MKKTMILLLILVLVMSATSGCSITHKPPNGVTQEFYDDMITVLRKLEKTKGEMDSDNGEDILEKYEDSKIWLSDSEVEIFEAVEDMHFWIWMYHNGKDVDEVLVRGIITDVSELMGLDLNTKKLMK